MQSHPFRSMLWKETRELLPLASAITIGSTAIQFTIALISSGVRAETLTGILVAIPSALCAAFVVAAGSIMFAGEKESETIDFLRRLPTSPRLVTHSKISAAILSSLLLAAVLIPITLLITHWKGDIEYLGLSRGNLDISAVSIVFAHLLVWAMFFSILTDKVLGSILLAILISTAAQTAYPYSSLILLVAFLILYSLKTRWFYDRPLFSGVFPTISISVSLPRMNFSFPTADDSRRSPRSRAARRLRWLELQRSWGFIACILIASLLWSFTLIGSESLLKPQMRPDLYQNAVLGPVVVIPLYLLILALLIAGISTFSFDQQNQCDRFFSERGVSPTALFWNKLLIWGSVGFVLPVLLFLVIELIYTNQTNQWQALGPDPLSVLCNVVLLCCISFTSGMLASLICKSRYVAFGLGLIFLVTALIWNGLVAGSNTTITWSLFPVPLILLLAARIRIPDWLLERNRFRHWLKLYAVILVPLSVCTASVPLYRAYSIPYVESLKFDKTVSELSYGEAEIRQLAAEIAIELRFVGPTPDKILDRTRTLHRAVNLQFSSNPFSLWFRDLSPAERGWEKAATEELFWIERNNWWLIRARQIESASVSVLPQISTSHLNAIVPHKDRLSELVYLHHLNGSRFTSEEKLDEALEEHLRAIRIASLRSRLFNNDMRFGNLNAARLGLVESEALVSWSFRWLHAWSLHPKQTPERMMQAIAKVDRLLQDLPSPLIKSSLLAHFLDQDMNQSGSPHGLGAIFEFPPWEKQRFRRAASIIVRDEVQRYAAQTNLSQSFPVVSNTAYGLGGPAGFALESYSRFSSESRKMSVWRTASWQLLRLCMVLKSHQLKHGSLPEDPLSLDPLESGEFQSVIREGTKLGIDLIFNPTTLPGELDLIAVGEPGRNTSRALNRLPKEVPFLFLRHPPETNFVPYTDDTDKEQTRFKISPPIILNQPNPLLFSNFDFILLPLTPTDLIEVPEPQPLPPTSQQTPMPVGPPASVRTIQKFQPPSPPPTNNQSPKATNITPD